MRIFVFFILFFSFPISAIADHHLVFIRTLVHASSGRCAVVLEISADEQDAFVETDNLALDDIALVYFTTLVASGINDTDANHHDGDTILIASPAFEESFDISADLALTESHCDEIGSDSVISYRINDTTEIDSIDLADLEDFGINTAVQKSSISDTPSVVDITSESISITNNAGDEATIEISGAGSGEPLVISSCRAQLGTSSTVHWPSTFICCLLTLLGIILRRQQLHKDKA